MTLVVEDGTGLNNAESYISGSGCAMYASNRGFTFTADATGDQALRRATAYVDQTYRLRFPGYRTNRAAQALEWPRTLAFYYSPAFQGPQPYFTDPRAYWPYDQIPTNAIPVEVLNATCEAAIREQAKSGVLFPDLKRGGQVKSYKAGPVTLQYGAGATPNTTFQAIEAALSRLIGPRNQYTAKASRG